MGSVRHARSGSSTESPAAWASRPDLTPGGNLGISGWAAQVHADMTVSTDIVEGVKRRMNFVPKHGSEEDKEGVQWRFAIDCEANSTVGEMRKQISTHIKVS